MPALRNRWGSWKAIAGLAVAALVPLPVWAVHATPDLRVDPQFGVATPPLMTILNPPAVAHGHVLPTSSGSPSLILKPDLGSCKEFSVACREGGIISPSPTHPLRTLGAGLGVRIGGVRLEYARGLQTGVNFIGVRTRFP